MKLRCWIEAMRLRTLPVSTAGVVAGCGYAYMHGAFRWTVALLCFLFALLAQVASNFANEYYDYKNGSDRRGRVGFRRGVTEGDISPQSMKHATYATLAAACAIGCCLIPIGGWKLVPIGIVIALFAMGYSAGPFPLSRIGLGDVAVLLFFGPVPVCLTFYLQTGYVSTDVVSASIAIGLMGVNVLIVNNYRDRDDDLQAGKRTTVVRFGRKAASIAYLLFGLAAALLTAGGWWPTWFPAPLIYLWLHITTWHKIRHSEGAALNPLLGATARNMLLYTLLLLAAILLRPTIGT